MTSRAIMSCRCATVRTQIKQALGKLGAKSQLSAVALRVAGRLDPRGDLMPAPAREVALRRDRRTSR